MSKSSKRIQNIKKKIDKTKQYDIKNAFSLLKEFSNAKFTESVDAAINLGIDPRKSDQNIRGATVLPYGTGRLVRVVVFTQGANAEKAKAAGADIVGMEDLVDKIKSNKINFNVVIASPDAMHIVSKLGQYLGPKGLMPNPKIGTVTDKIAEAVKNVKTGQISYRNDKNGIIHTTIGKINFDIDNLEENLKCLLNSIKKIKPASSKGIFIKKITVSTTMGIGIIIDQTSLLT
ncbi:50S ribosomal protein L1 [Candidatus Providencia siddallii]|uniref:Large ribosomal subunit protein uL1 n=1 Tax=Candidatus Providencia siddallii TaxID=1715285 RepID=A0A0M6W7P8_9GAMM|nr:50S ribosomal protein L1 [Candidatus Providencia siddallii]